MRAFQYNLAGMLTGEVEADESPMEPGVFHLPARSTFTEPPQVVPEGKWPRWNGVSWDLATQPAPAAQVDPVTKLKAFLALNPDVAKLLLEE